MSKKSCDFDMMIEFIKQTLGDENIRVHRIVRHNVKEVAFFDFTKWLKSHGVSQFSKKEFNDYCLNVAKVDIQYKGKGGFVFYDEEPVKMEDTLK